MHWRPGDPHLSTGPNGRVIVRQHGDSRRMLNAGSSTVRSSSPPSLWPEQTADAMVDGACASPIVGPVRRICAIALSRRKMP